MRNQIMQYMQLLIFLIPLGIIGVWRWMIWISKKVVAFFYRNPKSDQSDGSLAVVTPVYNENPNIFALAINSWLYKGLVDEVVAVIDYSDTACIEIFKYFMRQDARCKMIITKTPGKRQALVDGIKATQCEFVALTDSDTIWTSPLKQEVIGVFADARVGGAATRQDVYEPDTLAKRLFRIHLSNRYLNEMPFLATVDDALTCISGRTAIYRRSAVLPELYELTNETFLGKQVISGDDKTLTRLIQKKGWRVKYFKNVCVLTPGFEKIYPLLKQMVRWNRNSWRSDIQSLSSAWLWRKHKILGLYMLDRFVQPFTLLLGAIYFFVALKVGYWQIPLGLFVWWIVSRSVKIMSHLRRNPHDIVMVPVYVAFSYVVAVIKIYALITLNTQGWITRWHRERLKRNTIAQVGSAVVTVLVLGGYFGGVSWYQHTALQAMLQRQVLKNISIFSQGPRMFSEQMVRDMRTELLAKHAENIYGVYALKRKDTLTNVQNKFNLDDIEKITGEGNVPLQDKNRLPVGKPVQMSAEEMRSELDPVTLKEKKRKGTVPIFVWYDQRANTIRVKGPGAIITLADIQKRLGKNAALLSNDAGIWTLRSNLYISKNITLVIDNEEVSYLKLKSQPNGFVWLRGEGANIVIANTKITSWNEETQQPDDVQSDGRSFVIAKGSGRMDVLNSEIAYLGMEGAKRGGEFGGSYGLSWKIANKSFKSNLLTGSIRNSNIHHNYFGVYTFGVTGMTIANNVVHENEVYGIDPHDDSNNMRITENEVYKNGKHGIIISKRCNNNEIIGNSSRDNGYHGIMIHANSNNNVVSHNKVYGNHDGIAVYGSSENVIEQNDITQNIQGIRMSHDSFRNYLSENIIKDNRTAIHVYKNSNENFFIQNSVFQNKLGISLQEAQGNIFYDNLKRFDNGKDGSIALTAQNNEIK